MIVVHHLNDSRSQRILWLLEELELPYEIKAYARDAATRLAPPELTAVHPLGKSPVVTEDRTSVHESGAIIDYILRRHGAGRLAPPVGTSDYEQHQQWLHYAEGSAMLPLMLQMYVARLGEAGAPLQPRIESEIANHLGYIDRALEGRDYLMGPELTAADIQMSFPVFALLARGGVDHLPNLQAWKKRVEMRPAWQRAIEKGGPFELPGE